jgi:hypothetical protein
VLRVLHLSITKLGSPNMAEGANLFIPPKSPLNGG